MEPRIVERTEMILVGIVGSASDVGKLDIPGLWERFESHFDSIKHRVEDTSYEINIEEDFSPTMHFCFVGCQVTAIEDLDTELFAKTLPTCRYAVFTHRFSGGDYVVAFEAVYDWLEQSAYAPAHAFDILVYDERFLGPDNPDSEVEIHVPVVAKAEL
jgi:predicted transcriptional regulator YdeE